MLQDTSCLGFTAVIFEIKTKVNFIVGSNIFYVGKLELKHVMYTITSSISRCSDFNCFEFLDAFMRTN